MELVAGLPRQLVMECNDEWDLPFRQRIEWLVFRLCNNSHLIASQRIDQPTALDNCFRSDENEVDLIHDISDGGIEHHCARDAGCGQDLVGLKAVKNMGLHRSRTKDGNRVCAPESAGPSFGNIDGDTLAGMRMEKSSYDNSRVRVGKYLWRLRNAKVPHKCGAHHRVILDKSKRKFGYLGAKVDGLRGVAFPLVDDLPLELGEILR